MSCTVETCRQNYHVECVTDVLLTHAAKLESWRSREKYEVRLAGGWLLLTHELPATGLFSCSLGLALHLPLHRME